MWYLLFQFLYLCSCVLTGGLLGYALDRGHPDDGKIWQDIPSTLGLMFGLIFGVYTLLIFN